MELMSTASAQLSAFVASIPPLPPAIAPYVPSLEWIMEWFPLIYVSVLPLICLAHAIGAVTCFKTPEPEAVLSRLGSRVIRRVGIAVQADVRMITMRKKYGIEKTTLTPLKPAPGKKYVGVTSLTEPGGLGRGISSMDVESGTKKKMQAKSKASPHSGTGNYRSY